MYQHYWGEVYMKIHGPGHCEYVLLSLRDSRLKPPGSGTILTFWPMSYSTYFAQPIVVERIKECP